jgi:methionyl-tRNA formyltransferase
MSWQVLEGKNLIPITLFEAAETVDAGVVYARGEIALEGHELVDELRAKQWDKTRELLLGFLKRHPHNVGVAQTGEESFYPRRGPADGRLDLDRPLREQFNLLRISDNERYPAFFEAAGHRYVLKIEKVPHG